MGVRLMTLNSVIKPTATSIDGGTQLGSHVIMHPSDEGIDAFSRLRVSNPTTLFSTQAQYNMGTNFDFHHYTTTGGTISHLPNQSAIRLSTDTTAGAVCIRQSQRYIRYQPSKSQLIFVTFDFEAVDGGTKRVGYFDQDDGIFFEMDTAGDLFLVKRTSTSGTPSDTAKIAQASWNIDPLDGTGGSGFTIDGTKAQILIIDLQWLSTGRVRVGFDIDGHIIYVHEFVWANANSGVYMKTANLPVRWELAGNTNTTQMQAICCAVVSEGGYTTDLGNEFSTIETAVVSVSSGIPVISIRPRTSVDGLTNRGAYIPVGIHFYVSGAPVIFETVRGGTLTAASFASVSGTGVDVDSAATAIANGFTTNTIYVATGTAGGGPAGGGSISGGGGGSSDVKNLIYLTTDISGANVDTGNFTIKGTSLDGTVAEVYCNISFIEER